MKCLMKALVLALVLGGCQGSLGENDLSGTEAENRASEILFKTKLVAELHSEDDIVFVEGRIMPNEHSFDADAAETYVEVVIDRVEGQRRGAVGIAPGEKIRLDGTKTRYRGTVAAFAAGNADLALWIDYSANVSAFAFERFFNFDRYSVMNSRALEFRRSGQKFLPDWLPLRAPKRDVRENLEFAKWLKDNQQTLVDWGRKNENGKFAVEDVKPYKDSIRTLGGIDESEFTLYARSEKSDYQPGSALHARSAIFLKGQDRREIACSTLSGMCLSIRSPDVEKFGVVATYNAALLMPTAKEDLSKPVETLLVDKDFVTKVTIHPFRERFGYPVVDEYGLEYPLFWNASINDYQLGYR